MLIKDLPVTEKPRERLKKYGVKSLSDAELLAIILRIGIRSISVKEVALNVLKETKTIDGLKDMSLNKLSEIKGVGEVKAMTLLSSLELGRRVYLNQINKSKVKIKTTSTVFDIFKNHFIDIKQEEFVVLYLDIKKNLIEYKTLFRGTLNSSIIHPREIFKEAFKLSASAIICVHNHPSGDVTPSKEDIVVTRNILDVSKIMGITMLDHIIIGDNKYYSFLEQGLIK